MGNGAKLGLAAILGFVSFFLFYFAGKLMGEHMGAFLTGDGGTLAFIGALICGSFGLSVFVIAIAFAVAAGTGMSNERWLDLIERSTDRSNRSIHKLVEWSEYNGTQLEKLNQNLARATQRKS